MGGVQIVSTIIAAIVTLVAVYFVVRAVKQMFAVVRQGQPDPTRSDGKGKRTATMLRETLGHTRMFKWTMVGAAHWVVMVSFILLSSLVLGAYIEVVDPLAGLPLLDGWVVFGLVTEIFSVLGIPAILTLIVIRLLNLPTRRRWSRFSGSTSWQGYFVEYVILAVLVLGFLIRGLRVAVGHFDFPVWATPVSHALGAILPANENAITVVALLKILVSMAWAIVIGLNVTMGVAWHRFLAFPNIFFKRHASGKAALGALKPMMSGGKPIDLEEADPEKDTFGVAKIEDFSWKGLLDFSTCTECGRCQSQCPAWNTGKPLSPKLLVLSLRDHAYAKLQGGKETERPLIGGADELGVIDPDVLWSCTTCGACVEQCPVDIEHVDHIIDMRRYQVMIESSFPSEAGAMLRNLESKGNPWGAPPNTREEWTKGLDFPVPRVGEVDHFEYLFWVGCAGAFEDKAKKTTRAVATLLNEAGVSFAILGNNETCTGDPARRIGNEFVYQMLAMQNVETLKESGALKIVATCPHCFNTIGNEYKELGLDVEVVHHTELLSHLVKIGKLTPVQPIEGGLTYHDPCYLGRHNRVFSPPREVLNAASGGITEMGRREERSFCCGAGGARMYMEETIGKRINVERTEEALATGAKTIAVGCPFCSTMITDATRSKGAEEVEVIDVASVLLRAVKPL
ncbi:Fe-S oxidoreductase [Rhizocola hellebori]|uniref:Fe-S oxidoreductase n=1 Tax=Rhizocola hellebori TaxID=1392758 RepID=A0A8J3VHG4_9ACTN|nr:(Fe-S)-binding protein [Rhizocola hellebori]GIH05878.1 Fe-S oxidoreductase [Rhizocola hellebori]